MPRIPYPDYDSLSDEKKKILDGAEGRVINVSRMAMHAPDPLWLGQRRLGRAAAFAGNLDERLRELVILRVGFVSKCEYELFHHRKIADGVGITPEEIEAVGAGDFSGFSEKEQALLQFADEVIINVRPTDETLARVREHFSLELIFETVVMCGSYMITARVAGVSGVETDEDGPIAGWK